MQPRKLDILLAQFSYGGNGGFQSEHPDVGRYIARLGIDSRDDDRIGRFKVKEFADTPITMCRNRAVKEALKGGFDCLLMIDSDMKPDCELGQDPTAKPFFASSFDYLYEHFDKGPVCIAAPYCGPPPYSNVYVFHWANGSNPDQTLNIDAKIEAFSRYQAERMTGIVPCAALPTGLILFDTRLFTVVPPKPKQGWFYYEWMDVEASEKASTEDVTATRDMAYHGQLKLGYNPVLCNFDSWAGHHKPLCVRKPRSIAIDHVNEQYAEAVRRNQRSDERIQHFDFEAQEVGHGW